MSGSYKFSAKFKCSSKVFYVSGGDFGTGEDDQSLDYVSEFADVTWPVALLQCSDGCRSEVLDCPTLLLADLGGEELHEFGYIFLALVQWRYVNGNNVESVEEVLAERAFLNLLVKIFVGGCNDAYVDLNRFVAADACDFTFL